MTDAGNRNATAQLARRAEVAGDWPAALAAWERRLMLGEPSDADLIGLGRALRHNGRLQDSIDCLTAVFQSSPNDAVARRELAESLYGLSLWLTDLGKIEPALNALAAAQEVNPTGFLEHYRHMVACARFASLARAFEVAPTTPEQMAAWEAQIDAGRIRCVDVVNQYIAGLPWATLEKATVPRINALLETGWIASLMTARPVDRLGAPLPWLTYPAIDFLEPRIPAGARVFEWGGGASTAWWAKRAHHVHTIEGSAIWATEIRATVAGEGLGNATVEEIGDPEGYAGAIERFDAGTFDVVVIDGDARNACAARVGAQVKPDGLVVFDNSDMPQHRDGVADLVARGWYRIDFFGLIPAFPYRNCTTVFFRDPSVLGRAPLPPDHDSCLGLTCGQAAAKAASGSDPKSG